MRAELQRNRTETNKRAKVPSERNGTEQRQRRRRRGCHTTHVTIYMTRRTYDYTIITDANTTNTKY